MGQFVVSGFLFFLSVAAQLKLKSNRIVCLYQKKKKKDKTFFVDKEGAEIYCFKYFLSRRDVAWL